MQHRGAVRIHEATKDMTFDQKVAYWRERSRQFREEQERLPAALERHFGAFDSGDPKFSDNERIDADLAKEHDRHDERGG
jgi:hypothetical protein